MVKTKQRKKNKKRYHDTFIVFPYPVSLWLTIILHNYYNYCDCCLGLYDELTEIEKINCEIIKENQT